MLSVPSKTPYMNYFIHSILMTILLGVILIFVLQVRKLSSTVIQLLAPRHQVLRGENAMQSTSSAWAIESLFHEAGKLKILGFQISGIVSCFKMYLIQPKEEMEA